jgi:hypothetical protein
VAHNKIQISILHVQQSGETLAWDPTFRSEDDASFTFSMFIRPPAESPTSLAGNGDPVSASDNKALTLSPPARESSHDECAPECPSNAISVNTESTHPPLAQIQQAVFLQMSVLQSMLLARKYMAKALSGIL